MGTERLERKGMSVPVLSVLSSSPSSMLKKIRCHVMACHIHSLPLPLPQRWRDRADEEIRRFSF